MSDEDQQSLRSETRLQISSDSSHPTTESAATSSHADAIINDEAAGGSEIVPIITRKDSVDSR